MAKKRRKGRHSTNQRSKRQSIVDKIIHDIMNPRYDISELDTEKIIKMALLHDLAESITGDLTPDKISKKSKRQKENLQ